MLLVAGRAILLVVDLFFKDDERHAHLLADAGGAGRAPRCLARRTLGRPAARRPSTACSSPTSCRSVLKFATLPHGRRDAGSTRAATSRRAACSAASSSCWRCSRMLGMMVMISAHHFLTLYLGLELMSLSLYAMVALQRDSARATEAAMKYFVLGALASGLLLYGMSMIYGATGLARAHARGARDRAAATRDNTLARLRPRVRRGGHRLQAGRGAVPHVGPGRVPRRRHGRDAASSARRPKLAAFAFMMRLLVDGLRRPGRATGSRCW